MIFQNFFSRWNDFLEGEIIDLGGMFTSELKGGNRATPLSDFETLSLVLITSTSLWAQRRNFQSPDVQLFFKNSNHHGIHWFWGLYLAINRPINKEFIDQEEYLLQRRIWSILRFLFLSSFFSFHLFFLLCLSFETYESTLIRSNNIFLLCHRITQICTFEPRRRRDTHDFKIFKSDVIIMNRMKRITNKSIDLHQIKRMIKLHFIDSFS